MLFESVEGNERWARRSLIALTSRPTQQIRHLAELQALTAELPETPDNPLQSRFGFLRYEAARAFEKLPGIPLGDGLLGEFFTPDCVLLFDHIHHRVEAHFCDATEQQRVLRLLHEDHGERVRPDGPVTKRSVTRSCTSAEYVARVEKAKGYIAAGDAFQIVLSQRFTVDPVPDDLFETYRVLRRQNPSPYLYYVKTPHLEAAGASPETMLRVEHDTVTVRPLAGTRPRGKDDASDQALGKELLADEKERAEHIMLIDLGRNDVGRVSDAGSVVVDPLMQVERYSHVMHLVSEVRGRLRPECTALDAVASAFPAGTLSGAPKRRAMEIIGELEGEPRGLYGGAVGYFSSRRSCDFAIAIRTAFREAGQVVVQAGAGIVFDSVASSEDRECVNKAMSPLSALGVAAFGASAVKS